MSVLLYCNQKRSSIQGLEYTFQHPETSYTHTSHTCRSLFLGPFEAARGVQDLAIHRDRHSGHAHAATATAQHYVRILPRTQAQSRQASRTMAVVARTAHSTMEGSCGASTAGRRRPDHKTTIRPLPCDVRPRSRARQPPGRPAKARQRAGHTAAGHHAAAATKCTKCSECSQILQAYGEKWMSASAAGKRRVLGRSNAHLTCTQGTWRPTDVVRATHGRPARLWTDAALLARHRRTEIRRVSLPIASANDSIPCK